MMEEFLPIISAAGGVLCAGLPIIWRLASRLQKIESMMEGQTDEIKSKLDAIDVDVSGVLTSQKEAAEIERGGRKELWVEVSALRERLVKIETKMNGGTP